MNPVYIGHSVIQYYKDIFRDFTKEGDEVRFENEEEMFSEELASQTEALTETEENERKSKINDDPIQKRIEIQYNESPFIIETEKDTLTFDDLFDYIDFD